MTSHSSVQDKWGFVLWVLRPSYKWGVCLHQTNKQKSLRMFKVSSFSALSEAASESRSVVTNSLWPHGLYSPWNSLDHNTGVGSLSLLQGIFATQGSNPGLPHCRQILYQLSHKGSPRILGAGSSSLLQRIFPTQELNQGLLNCSWILYQLNYQGNWTIKVAEGQRIDAFELSL